MLLDRELKLRDSVLNILKYEGNVKSDSLNFLAKQISSQKLEWTDAIAKSIDNAMVVAESSKSTKKQH